MDGGNPGAADGIPGGGGNPIVGGPGAGGPLIAGVGTPIDGGAL